MLELRKSLSKWVVSCQVLDKKVQKNAQIFSTYCEGILSYNEKCAINKDKLSQTIFQKTNSLKSCDLFIAAVYQYYRRHEYYRTRDWSFIQTVSRGTRHLLSIPPCNRRDISAYVQYSFNIDMSMRLQFLRTVAVSGSTGSIRLYVN